MGDDDLIHPAINPEEATYGQVIINDGNKLAISDGFGSNPPKYL
ncbi:hypothetical protein [Peribacillus sp. CSMR9]|nr:hypothetical protein [Peribacillus sp. CSMR9]MDV7767576.1 hypothetical protein [Peribacillus sp. CSMR9]